MASVVVDNTTQVRLIWQYNGTDVAVNVLHGINKDPLKPVDQAFTDGLKTAIAGAFNASTIKGQISAGWALNRIGVRDLDQANFPEYVGSGITAVGGNSNELLPLHTCMCVTLRTGKAGTSYRGRTYVSGFTEGGSVAGVASGTVVSSAQDWVTRLQAAFDTGGLTLAVASRKLGKSEAVTSIQARDTRWDTQRRRIVPGI